jgi:hypothetical protein
MEDKKPQRRERFVLDRERDLLQSYFKDNEDLLLALRNLLFGFDLDERETAMLAPMLKSQETIALLNKMFFPQLGKDIPVGQSIDLWMIIKLEDPQQYDVNLKAHEVFLAKIDSALKRLLDPKVKVDLTCKQSPADIKGRNTFIQHIEGQLTAIRVLANEKVETPEERIMKQAKDSLK